MTAAADKTILVWANHIPVPHIFNSCALRSLDKIWIRARFEFVFFLSFFFRDIFQYPGGLQFAAMEQQFGRPVYNLLDIHFTSAANVSSWGSDFPAWQELGCPVLTFCWFLQRFGHHTLYIHSYVSTAVQRDRDLKSNESIWNWKKNTRFRPPHESNQYELIGHSNSIWQEIKTNCRKKDPCIVVSSYAISVSSYENRLLAMKNRFLF